MRWFECWKSIYRNWFSLLNDLVPENLTKQPWGSTWNPEDCFSKEVFHQMFWLHMTCPLGFSADVGWGSTLETIHSCWSNSSTKWWLTSNCWIPIKLMWILVNPPKWWFEMIWCHEEFYGSIGTENFDPSQRISVKLWHWGILFYLAAGQGKLLASTSIWPPRHPMDVFWIMVPLLVYVNIALFVSWFAPMETLGSLGTTNGAVGPPKNGLILPGGNDSVSQQKPHSWRSNLLNPHVCR